MRDVHAFAEQHDVPIIHFTRDQKKDAVAGKQRVRFSADEGVVFIGIAQETPPASKGTRTVPSTG